MAALEQEVRELRLKVRRLETQLAEKEAELARRRGTSDRVADSERLRASQQQSERLLEAREQSHRQQVLRLENQASAEKYDNYHSQLSQYCHCCILCD